MKKRVIQEMYDALSDIRGELSHIDGQLLPLRRIADQLAALARAERALSEAGRAEREAAQTRFVAQIEAVQRDRPPDSAELQLVRSIANHAGGVLRALEWSGNDAGTRGSCCPICHAAKGGDHRPDCELFAVIGPPRLADTEI